MSDPFKHAFLLVKARGWICDTSKTYLLFNFVFLLISRNRLYFWTISTYNYHQTNLHLLSLHGRRAIKEIFASLFMKERVNVGIIKIK
jgi:hypothetical protein